MSTGTCTVITRGAYGLISSGLSIASLITSRMCSRASRAWVSAPASTEAGMPSSLVSSWIAVTNSAGAGDLEVHVTEGVLGAEDVGERRVLRLRPVRPSTMSDTRPMAMPATGARSGTPALSSDSVDAQTEPIDVDPLELSASETCRIA